MTASQTFYHQLWQFYGHEKDSRYGKYHNYYVTGKSIAVSITFLVSCLFGGGAHLYYGEKKGQIFKLVCLCNKGLLIECEIY